MVLGITFGITFLIIVKLVEFNYYKLGWTKIIDDLKNNKFKDLGEFELIIYQEDSVTLQQIRITRHLFGINRAKVFKDDGRLIFLPWSKEILLNRYYSPFQILLNDKIPGLNSITADWTFNSKHLEEKWDYLSITFLAPDIKTTSVQLTIKNWRR